MENATTLLEEGQGVFCDIIKVALYQQDETIFERLDFENDALYMEPMLFGYCTQKDQRPMLPQVLFGNYAPEQRPTNFTVYTNRQGVIYLPQYGAFQTTFPSTALQAIYTPTTDQIVFSKDQTPIDAELTPLRYLPQLPKAELTHSVDVYSEALFYVWARVPKEHVDALLTQQAVDLDTYQPALEQALEWLRTYFPEEFELYRLTTRKIVLFSSPLLRNFASREMHGTVYLNVNEHSNATFFLEELIHQCSHTVFNAMTHDAKRLFLVDHNRSVGEFNGTGDARTLYGALHGIYTTGKIVDLFIKLLKAQPNIDPELLHELCGRVAINKNRHNIGLEKVDLDTVFTKEGKALFCHYYQQLDDNIQQNPVFFEYNMTQHPIVFSYQQFKLDNPIEET